MSLFETFNKRLIDNKENINLLDYVKQCNFTNIDISFIDTFIELATRTDFCIPHTYLKDYGIYKLTGGSSDLEKKLETNGFKEDVDYKILLRKVSEQDLQHGGNNKNDYMLTPDTFKTLLIRSTKCKTYANYYIYLEKCIKYFNDYQIDLKEKYIISLREKMQEKDNCILQLQKEMKQQTEKIDELLKNSRESQERLTVTEGRLSDVEDELVTTSDNLDSTMASLSVVQDKLEIAVEDRAIKPYDKSKINQIGILKSKEHNKMYYLTCGQKDSVCRAIRLRYRTHILIDTIDGVPNSIYLFDHIKKHLGSKAKAISRSMQLISIDELTFIDEIRSLFDGRRNIDLTKRP